MQRNSPNLPIELIRKIVLSTNLVGRRSFFFYRTDSIYLFYQAFEDAIEKANKMKNPELAEQIEHLYAMLTKSHKRIREFESEEEAPRLRSI